ncbi:MAG TPA: hypothetical protein VHN99_01035 [Deinococcales bacterium]|nr:hypothetical protein [Deinococcales bacterium]
MTMEPDEIENPVVRKREALWLAQVAVVLVALLQLTLGERFTLGPVWLAPLIESVLLVPLIATTSFDHLVGTHWRRATALAMIGVINASNFYALFTVVHRLLSGSKTTGVELIYEAMKVWATNMLLFALWYWELDRGGPGARRLENTDPPDFLFPQMTVDVSEHCEPGWAPNFIDYLFVSFTNATAFSPTDTLPLRHRAKALMMLQALISLITLALVASRAVNILA